MNSDLFKLQCMKQKWKLLQHKCCERLQNRTAHLVFTTQVFTQAPPRNVVMRRVLLCSAAHFVLQHFSAVIPDVVNVRLLQSPSIDTKSNANLRDIATLHAAFPLKQPWIFHFPSRTVKATISPFHVLSSRTRSLVQDQGAVEKCVEVDILPLQWQNLT